MTQNNNLKQKDQVVAGLSRQSSQADKETSIAASVGAQSGGWVAEVISNQSYNHYNVRAVELGEAGSSPIGTSHEMTAINVAESFYNEGSLALGTYVVLSRVGVNYVFYAPV